jgi:hypothetical protein
VSLEDLKIDIRTASAITFCRQSLFNSRSWYFENADKFGLSGNYDDFRFQVGTQVNTSPNNVAIIGSAKFGYSLNPAKNFSEFGGNSDIDVVIVSPELFEQTWAQFRLALFRGYDWIQKRHATEIIRKYIVLSGSEHYDTAYLRDVAIMILQMRKTIRGSFKIQHSLNYRIYASWNDVEMYHVFGIEQLKDILEKVDA